MSSRWFDRRTKCPACVSEKFTTLYQSEYDKSPIRNYLQEFYAPIGGVELEHLTGSLFILCECDACGLIFQRDIPNDALMEKLYEHWIDPRKIFDQHQRQDGLTYYSSYAREIMSILSSFGTAPSSLRFLDFGMGWGKWALMVKAFGCDSYGTELSQVRIEYARSNGLKVITWDEIPDHRFDVINAEKVFEHIPEPLATLRHLKKALKPGGIVRINVPAAGDMRRRLKIMDWTAPKGSRDSLNPVAPLEHINLFGRSSLERMAEESGLEEVSIPPHEPCGDTAKLSATSSNTVNIASFFAASGDRRNPGPPAPLQRVG